MKIKTSKLTDAALDWAVAKCLTGGEIFQCGRVAHQVVLHSVSGTTAPYFMKDSGVIRCAFEPSTNWSQGGPIIGRIKGLQLKNWLESKPETCCEVHIHNYEGDWIQFGPTPLIAAMRCYVASKLGDTVEIPEELK